MFYELVEILRGSWGAFNVFRYITFRAAYATVTALLICFVFGGWAIAKLRSLQIGETIREEGPEGHHVKAGTPTMGGLLILAAIIIPMLLWGNLGNQLVKVALLSTVFMGLLGFIDDYLKVVMKKRNGLSGRWKILAQGIFGLVLALWMVRTPEYAGIATESTLPFFKGVMLNWGWLYVPLVVLVFSGTTNAVNLADGLDGLAVGLAALCFAAFAVLAYVTGNSVISGYLNILFLRDAGELAVFAMAVLGASLGFLWYNAHPAEVFMGDTGAMALGGALASVALLIKQELLLVVIGGVFVAEALSVALQVLSYRLRSGKRIFLMAPIHHHFEKLGWSESKVVIRFWIVGALLVLLSVSTLKLR
ncbi:MAG TPA: phospho-N-acetylmuramoyl-pentapeptide-transferase [Candidatus Krumholzibacteria bacterium]|nr:phospho-N-acetylmuramoyl-pentapeptide-transferase [Candidatus Krumholzibacteria bacterium]